MRTTRSGRTYSPFEVLLNSSADIELLLANAFERSTNLGSSDDRSGEWEDGGLNVVDVASVAVADEGYVKNAARKDPAQNMQDNIMLTKAEKDKKRRAQKRRMRREVSFWKDGQPANIDVLRKIMEGADILGRSLIQGDILHLPSSSCGYQAKPTGETRQRCVLKLQDIMEKGYEIIPWNGIDTKLITHGSDKTIIAACVGWNGDRAEHESLAFDAYVALKTAREDVRGISTLCCDSNNPRGNFKTILSGINHGHGSQQPHNVVLKPDERRVIDKLLNSKSMIRLANFASASLSMFAPKVYDHYHKRMKSLAEHPEFGHLKRPFPGSIFACAGFNIGERVSTFMHRDCMNCPFGWCSVQAFGPFDPKKGGHMVLDDLKVAIEFPSGSLMMIPSATLKHGNAQIEDGEDRVSFTQFTPGNLFRFIDCNFQTEKSIELADPAAFDRILAMKKIRWKEGVKMWSTVDELMNEP